MSCSGSGPGSGRRHERFRLDRRRRLKHGYAIAEGSNHARDVGSGRPRRGHPDWPAAANSPRIPAESPDRVYPYDAQVLGCADEKVLGRIQGRFDSRETRYWNSELKLVKFEHVRETSFRPNGHDLIPRRYCTGKVILSDNSRRGSTTTLSRTRAFPAGTAACSSVSCVFPTPSSFNVEWCISGLDRQTGTYAPDCRMARP